MRASWAAAAAASCLLVLQVDAYFGSGARCPLRPLPCAPVPRRPPPPALARSLAPVSPSTGLANALALLAFSPVPGACRAISAPPVPYLKGRPLQRASFSLFFCRPPLSAFLSALRRVSFTSLLLLLLLLLLLCRCVYEWGDPTRGLDRLVRFV